MNARSIKLGGRTVPLTNLDKRLFPSGFTKAQVIDYYAHIAPVLLPYLKDRALTLKRFPNGSDGMYFFEKQCPMHRPTWVKTAEIEASNHSGSVRFCVINDLASLLWVANLASLELHVSLARITNPDRPTVMVFDLDPGAPAGVIESAGVAMRLRKVLDEHGLQCFPKWSGGKGLHVYVPLNGAVTFDQTKAFSRAIALQLAGDDPHHVTATMTRSLRRGKVFIDWSQNDRHKTTVCVYSLRAKDQPTVSTPMTWKEVEKGFSKGDESAFEFDAPAVIERVAHHGDLFAGVLKLKQRLKSIESMPVGRPIRRSA